MEKPKFEVKPLVPKSPEEEPLDKARDETEPEREIEVWENEGGPARPERQEEAPEEVPETIVEEPRVEKSWREILTQAKDEFPEDIKMLIKKINTGETLNSQQQSRMDKFEHVWFRENFGIRLKKAGNKQKPAHPEKDRTEEEMAELKRQREEIGKRQKEKRERKVKKRQAQLERLAEAKRNKMEQLHTALRNLDAGENVEDFLDETRKVVYFDEENRQYFVEENGKRINIGIGDIVSDYAWGVKYLPDSHVADSRAYRALAKRILANETRRNLERIHNYELSNAEGFNYKKFKESFIKAKEKAKESLLNQSGFIAEIMIREFLSRIGVNHNLDFIVSRATIREDLEFKYDFKIRVKHKIRGVDVDGKLSNKHFGFDLKTNLNRKGVFLDKTQKGKRVEVDEIFILKVPSKDIIGAFRRWLNAGEPSGGPEQFLSPKLKKAILKAITEKLVDIPQEIFDKIQ